MLKWMLYPAIRIVPGGQLFVLPRLEVAIMKGIHAMGCSSRLILCIGHDRTLEVGICPCVRRERFLEFETRASWGIGTS